MTRDLVRPLAIAAALLALLTLLLVESRDPDIAAGQEMLRAMQRYQLYDVVLTRDVLQARAGLVRNYDRLAADRRNLVAAFDDLKATRSTGSRRLKAVLQGSIDALEQSMQTKLDAVERFKSKNALLRNSLMYMTFVALPSGIDGRQKLPSPDFGRLAYALLRDVQMPEKDEPADVDGLLKRLASDGLTRPEMATLADHGRLVEKVAHQADALLRKILGVPAEDAPVPLPAQPPSASSALSTGAGALELGALQEAVRNHLLRAETRAGDFRLSLYAVAVLLLGYVAWQFARLRVGARTLGRANTDLKHEMAERARASAALESSEERMRAISDSAKEAIISAGADGNIVSWNAGAQAMFGYPASKILGLPLSGLWPADVRARQETALAAFFRTDDPRPALQTAEFEGLRSDGRMLPLEVSLSIWTTGQGRFLTAIMRDISERKQLEEHLRQNELQLIQADRMKILGLQVSSVAHEIANPIGSILSNSRDLARLSAELADEAVEHERAPDASSAAAAAYRRRRVELPELASDIFAAADRIRLFVDDLKHFYRPRRSSGTEPFDLNAAVTHAAKLLRKLIEDRTSKLNMQLASDLPQAQGNAQHFEQVVLNLLVNALEALPDKGRCVHIATSWDRSRNRLLLQVEDQGIGIPKENLARICEQFFTTKQSSGGTGLGLAITKTLLEAMGGEIQFQSEAGRGTRVTVQVACAAAALTSA